MDDNTETIQEKLEDAVKNNDSATLKDELEHDSNVNFMNKDGDTLLHIAIDSNVGYDCLKLLLEHGASTSAPNKMGLKPLHVIDPESSDTFLDLLRLQEYFDAKDYRGNTILHFLMMYGYAEEALQKLALNKSAWKIDFNVQNVYGQTPLHLAANNPLGERSLGYILSNFDDLNLVLQDFRGNTFLHSYLNEFGGTSELELLRNIFDGKYKCCFGAVLKQLLDINNEQLKTPFLLYIEKGGLYNELDICQDFQKAGTDMNSSDIKGDTAIHNMFYVDEEQLPVVEFLVRNGVDVNKKNIFLETPLFHSNTVPIIQELIDNGADVNAQNKVEKTVLMAKLLEKNIPSDVVRMLLDNGANVNAADAHGNTCLHYAGWRNLGKDLVQLIKNAGAKSTKNNYGELPCFVADSLLHAGVIDDLCMCPSGTHTKQVPLKEAVVKVEEICGVMKACTVKPEITRLGVSRLLRLPHVGSVEFKAEAEDLRQTVIKVVADICIAIGERDELLKNTLFQSGSVGEKTKIGLPDEFDFICLIEFVSKTCEMEEARSQEDSGYAYVRLKEEHRNKHYMEVFDANCNLESELIYTRFVAILRDVLSTPGFYQHPNLVFGFDETKEGASVPNCKFSLRWTGAVFKDVLIDVDLVPACRIPYWWPVDSNLGPLTADKEMIQTGGALLLLQMVVDEDYVSEAKLRVSAQGAEKALMQGLPQIARDAYMVSKLLCSERVCPNIQLSEDSEYPSYLKKCITSYMLKNCMFHVYHEEMNADIAAVSGKVESTLHEFVLRIFKKLISFTESETLPAFIFPWLNIFSSQQGNAADDTADDAADDDDSYSVSNKQEYMCRMAYCKLILNMLGEDVDFRDWDIEAIYD